MEIAAFLMCVSVALGVFFQFDEPPTSMRLALSLLALTNTLIGWWLMARLWREGAPPPQGDPPNVQRPADHQT